MSQVLKGIKVLELGSFVAVPAAGTILSDLGAEVVKVEHPVTGDPGRGFDVNTKGVITHEGGLNVSFELFEPRQEEHRLGPGKPGGAGGSPPARRALSMWLSPISRLTGRSATACGTKTCRRLTRD